MFPCFYQFVPFTRVVNGPFNHKQYVSAYTLLVGVVQSGKGLSFSNLNDGFNGMSVAMGIMAVEWALFLVLAWYFDQVLYTGEPPLATVPLT